MTIGKKFFLIFGIFLLAAAVAISGSAFYLYHHPEHIKPIIERSLSASTSSHCSIESLSFSVNPLVLAAEGIHFKPLDHEQKFLMEIRFVRLDMAIEGPFGHRILTLKTARIENLFLRLFPGSFTSPVIKRKDSSSFPARTGRLLAGFFLFKEIHLHFGEILDGRIFADMGEQTILADRIHGRAESGKPLSLSLSLEVRKPSRHLSLTAPEVNIVLNETFNLLDLGPNGSVRSTGMTLQSPWLGIRRVDMAAEFTYTHANKQFDTQNLRVDCEDIVLRTGMEPNGLTPVFESSAETLSMESSLAYDGNQGKIAFDTLSIKVHGLSVMEKAKTSIPAMELHINAEGAFYLLQNRLDIQRLHLTLADSFKMDGSLHIALGQKNWVHFRMQEAFLVPEKLFLFLPLQVKETFKPLKIGGSVFLKGNFNGTREEDKWRWECDLESRMAKNPCAYLNGPMRLKGLFSTTVKAKGRFPDIIISAEMDGDQIVFSTEALNLEPFKAHASLSGRYPKLDFKEVALSIPRAQIDMKRREIPMENIRIHIPNCRVNVEKKSADVPEVRLDASHLKNLLLTAQLTEKKVELGVKGKESGLLDAAAWFHLLPPDWRIAGRDTIQINAASDESGPWHVKAKFLFEDMIFQNNDGSLMGENIALAAGVEGIIDLVRSGITFDASLEASKGEALYDRFYLNLKKNPVVASGKSSWNFQENVLQIHKLRFAVKDILPLEMQGRLKRNPIERNADFRVSVPPVSLAPIFHHILQEPYKTLKPFLANLETGGTVSAECRITNFQDVWETKGRFKWYDGKLISKEGDIALKGIRLDLPVWYGTRHEEVPVEEIEGSLDVQSVTIPPMPEQPLSFFLDATMNRISVNSPTAIRIPGGEFRLGPVQISDPLGPDFSIQTSLTLDGIKLQPFLSGIWMRPLEGGLHGRLDPIRYKGHAITSHGEIFAEIFNGIIRLSDLGASGVLTAAPVFKLNGQAQDLMLAEMTTDTSFGMIEGVLNAQIQNFEIARGQPQRFDLLLETVKEKGIPQRISVKAIDNIAKIGGGRSPFMGMAGILASLFKTFPYEKIGIRARLENDVFAINGVIREGGTEYLVKRSGISGVNVVNQNPDNRISFKDMVKRIKRITHEGEPVVK